MTIGAIFNGASLDDGLGQVLQNRLGVFPAYAGVGDADAVLEACFSFLGDLLVACCTSVGFLDRPWIEGKAPLKEVPPQALAQT